MNNVVLTGNIGRDIEIKFSKEGKAYLNNSIAVKDNYKKDKTHWINFSAFGKTAEIMAEYLTKGSKIGIIGSLNYSEFEKNGEKRNSLSVNVDRMEMLDSKPKTDAPTGSRTTNMVEANDSSNSDVPF